MLFIVRSVGDPAGMNIGDRLLELYVWEGIGKFEGNIAYRLTQEGENEIIMLTINEYHIYAENLDKEIAKAFGAVEGIIFLSMHKSASGRKTLTVHPIGNYAKAEAGGRDYTLVPTMPGIMTEALRRLRSLAKNTEYSVSFEVTHHGPYLEAPTFFIEIGSDENAWNDINAAGIIAKSLMMAIQASPLLCKYTAVGVGGGHYVPRFSDFAMQGVCFGHMIPSYALPYIKKDIFKEAVEKTPNCTAVVIHKKSRENESSIDEVSEWARDMGLEIIM